MLTLVDNHLGNLRDLPLGKKDMHATLKIGTPKDSPLADPVPRTEVKRRSLTSNGLGTEEAMSRIKIFDQTQQEGDRGQPHKRILIGIRNWSKI